MKQGGLRWWVAIAMGFVMPVSFAAARSCDTWPDWRTFKTHYLEGGRIIDRSSPQAITTSEGQAYGLFFALIANDRATFDQLLTWTENDLAQGDLTTHLPAWLWGRHDDGQWMVLDRNPASDADVWIAYTLGEAGRLWHDRRLRILSKVLARRIVQEESAPIAGLGLSLLPAPHGFHPADDRWRLNPSYVPIQLLRGLARGDAQSPWGQMIPAALRLLQESAPKGYAPDWALYRTGEGFLPDADTQARGSYNAIRVYLWAGLLSRDEPLRARLLETLRPMATLTIARGLPPERVDTQTGTIEGDGALGFSAALVPFLTALGARDAAKQQAARVRATPLAKDAYYSSVLSLFGMGGHDGVFRFAADGSLGVRWSRPCVVSHSH